MWICDKINDSRVEIILNLICWPYRRIMQVASRMTRQTSVVHFLHSRMGGKKLSNLPCILLQEGLIPRFERSKTWFQCHKINNESSFKEFSSSTCCFWIRRAIVLSPRKQSQQSNGAKPDPSAFCRKYSSFANLKRQKIQGNYFSFGQVGYRASTDSQ